MMTRHPKLDHITVSSTSPTAEALSQLA